MWTETKLELPPVGKLVLVIRNANYALAFLDHAEVVFCVPEQFSHTLTWREIDNAWEEDAYGRAVTHWTLLPKAPLEVSLLAPGEDPDASR